MKIKSFLENGFLIFDGAMGTMLQKKGLKIGEIPEMYNMLYPDIIEEIHRVYIKAGADIITTNTFGANEIKLKDSKYEVEDIIQSAVEIAKKAAGDNYVALDLGPIGKLLEPTGDISFERAYNIFKRQVVAGVKAGCDAILIETFSDIYEAKAAILAAKENSSVPVFCTMTFNEDKRTLMGTDPLTMVNILQGLGVDALGINCSLGPKEIMPIVSEILKYSSIPVMVQPNAGLPKVVDGKTVYGINEIEFSDYIIKMAKEGALIFGGCCGTNEKYIKQIKKELTNINPIKLVEKNISAVSSSTKTVVLGNEVKIIGERINPTGKKKFKEALKNSDINYIINEALKQKESGADILDVNVGLPEIDEIQIMKKAIKNIQEIVELPLQIDSSDYEVIENAVRIYNGKPIINSVNGKESSMEKIFPIAKKYGALIVALTLDEKGIPLKAIDRFNIAKKIIKTAEEYGIKRENILIDCLVLTASAQQNEVLETLKAVKMVKDKLKVNTVLGVSNVSFGLPNRENLNKTFLAMALMQGLDAPIINPLSSEIMGTINAFKVLANQDKESSNYVAIYSSGKVSENKKQEKLETEIIKKNNLKEIVIKGLKEEAKEETKKLLKEIDSLRIVDEYLIPGLDIVGDDYEKGDIFLPQLINSAETVKNSFNVIKENMKNNNEKSISKGKIILATVKGDVHDIGKNIVKVLLENYGYEIIDLGKDVPIEKIVKTVKNENIKLVGLSALMTTTVISMKETINALKANNIKCKIMVGGAVLNQEYADMIGADFYAKDAREAVKIAGTVQYR
ncbi:MAG: homocysteine S-methyltransferase family protein [Clostridiaceae bacterium]